VKKISLIQLLKYEKNCFYMNIPLCENIAEKSKTIFPFQIMDDSGKLARVVQGEIKINETTNVKKVLLLVQRDKYFFEYSDLNPVTNSIIDQRWNYSVYSNKKNLAFHFAASIEDQDEPALFKSLFYCRKTNSYFHPPCPLCASELDLCMDDDLLKKNALPSYNNSLKRYLYCPKCMLTPDKTEFYCYSKDTDDPGYVKDRFDLIHDFKKIHSVGSDCFFPCHICKERMDCYMIGEKADTRISFFSFYPFQMICFNDADLTLETFLPLISGADVDEIDELKKYGITLPDKQKLGSYVSKQAFFFNDDHRFFLEVMYLKLSLLRETAKIILIRSKQSEFYEFELSLKKIWINLTDKESVLPYLWNFSIAVLDVPDKIDHMGEFLKGNSFSKYFASLWLYIFFVNKNQRAGKVLSEARKIFEQSSASELTPNNISHFLKDNQIFQSYQIFWDNSAFIVHNDYLDLWNKTAKIPFSLFFDENKIIDFHGIESIMNDIDYILNKIKTSLFAGKPVIPKSEKSKQQETTAAKLCKKENQNLYYSKIHNILDRIKKKWKYETIDDDDYILETVALSTPAEKINMLFENKYKLHSKKIDIADNTLKEKSNKEIFLNNETLDKTAMPTHKTQTEGVITKKEFDFDLDQTVKITPDKLSKNSESRKKSFDTDLDKTVIIAPEKI